MPLGAFAGPATRRLFHKYSLGMLAGLAQFMHTQLRQLCLRILHLIKKDIRVGAVREN